MLQAYLDDSGGTHPRFRYFVLAGFMADAGVWVRFSSDWKSVLDADPKIEYFKNSESLSRKGQFNNWKWIAVQKKVSKLLDVILSHKLHRISCHINHADFDHFLRVNNIEILSNPYHLLFFNVIVHLNKYASDYCAGSCVKFIFDEQGKLGYDAVRIFKSCVDKSDDDLRSKYSGLPNFEDDKKLLPIQASDMFAGRLRRLLFENYRLYAPMGPQIRAFAGMNGVNIALDAREISKKLPFYLANELVASGRASASEMEEALRLAQSL